jgi:hypothetical protein
MVACSNTPSIYSIMRPPAELASNGSVAERSMTLGVCLGGSNVWTELGLEMSI